jgi:hypothetical protein
MDRDQLDALVARYLDTELTEVEHRLATGAWRVNDHGDQGDWHDVALSLLAEQAEELEQALAYNHLRTTLPIAEGMLPNATPEAKQVLAR